MTEQTRRCRQDRIRLSGYLMLLGMAIAAMASAPAVPQSLYSDLKASKVGDLITVLP